MRESDLLRKVAGGGGLRSQDGSFGGVLLLIAFELGGETGSRLAHELGLLVSPDTLLQRVRDAPPPNTGEVRVLWGSTISLSGMLRGVWHHPGRP